MYGIVNQNGGGSNVKSVQRLTVTMHANQDNNNNSLVTISPVDVTSSIAYVTGTTGAGNVAHGAFAEILNSTTLKVYFPGEKDKPTWVSIEVVEFKNVKSLQLVGYSIVLPYTDSTFQIPISPVDVSKSLLIASKNLHGISGITNNPYSALCSLSHSNINVRIKSPLGETHTIRAYVVEFK